MHLFASSTSRGHIEVPTQSKNAVCDSKQSACFVMLISPRAKIKKPQLINFTKVEIQYKFTDLNLLI